MYTHKINCKFCGQYKEINNRKKKPPRYCDSSCYAKHFKNRSIFIWESADEESKKAKILQNFYRNIIIKNGCWGFKTKCKHRGYPFTEVGKRKTKTLHRLSYELHYGKIPKSMLVRHLCNNPECCRPSHLTIGTPADNSMDMVKSNRQCIGEKNTHSKLTEKKVKEIKKLIKENKISQTEIGNKYGVTQSAIWYIKEEKNWKHVSID